MLKILVVPRLLWNMKINYRVLKSFILILSSVYSKCYIPLRVSEQNLLFIFHFFCASYMCSPSHQYSLNTLQTSVCVLYFLCRNMFGVVKNYISIAECILFHHFCHWNIKLNLLWVYYKNFPCPFVYIINRLF